MLTPGEMNWKDNPRVPGLGVARIISSGKKAGPYLYRVRFPKGRVVKAHSHPDDRTYTVLSGTWHIGWGEKYGETKLTPCLRAAFILNLLENRISSQHQTVRRLYRSQVQGPQKLNM